MFYVPVKYTEKLHRIFQFADVKIEAKGKVPSEVIQKTNSDSDSMNENYIASKKPGP